MNGSSSNVRPVKCASNMRQIGQGIAMYANDHHGQFPDDLKTLLENEDLTAAVFICPSSNDEPAPMAATTQATALGLLQAGHLSYVYLDGGRSRNDSSTGCRETTDCPLSTHRPRDFA